MKRLSYPDTQQLAAALARPADTPDAGRREKAAAILAEIKLEGDASVRRYSALFDGLAFDNM